jgi:hypothetical protein
VDPGHIWTHGTELAPNSCHIKTRQLWPQDFPPHLPFPLIRTFGLAFGLNLGRRHLTPTAHWRTSIYLSPLSPHIPIFRIPSSSHHPPRPRHRSHSSPTDFDFSRAVPIPSYCHRDGVLNIASHSPPDVVAPDLGALLIFLPCCVEANLGTSRPNDVPHSRRPLAHKRGGCVQHCTRSPPTANGVRLVTAATATASARPSWPPTPGAPSHTNAGGTCNNAPVAPHRGLTGQGRRILLTDSVRLAKPCTSPMARDSRISINVPALTSPARQWRVFRSSDIEWHSLG